VSGNSAGDWMQTYTGRAFYPMAPSVASVDPLDVAHALSLLCRYGGQCRWFYSVAEHCVLMSEAVSPENALWALLHDATEAYLGDMIRPLKQAMPAYRAAEYRLMEVICDRFDIDRECPAEVKAADNRILRDERDALMGAPPRLWESIEQLPPLGVNIHGWPHRLAERRYLERLHDLTAAREVARA
jgi:5'-nucleotidase